MRRTGHPFQPQRLSSTNRWESYLSRDFLSYLSTGPTSLFPQDGRDYAKLNLFPCVLFSLVSLYLFFLL